MGKIFYYIKKCRLCNGEIKEEINFGKVAIGNDLSNHFHNAKKLENYLYHSIDVENVIIFSLEFQLIQKFYTLKIILIYLV